jgi:MFS transporter, SP family, arabinose:H+ symporter
MNATTRVPRLSAARHLNVRLAEAAFSAALGGLLFGFDTAVISGTTRALTGTYGLSPGALGFTVASALWGTVFGAMLAGIPADRLGRRGSLKGLAVLYLASAVGCAGAWNWTALLLFRFLGGLAIGGSSVVGPMYIAEVAPAKKRGGLVAFFQFNVVLGILLAYVSNYLVGLLGTGDLEWRWKLGAPALPALFFLLMLLRIPQSPRWLAQKGRMSEAAQVLELTGAEDVTAELRAIADALEAERGLAGEKLFTRSHRFPIFLAVSIAMFNQLAGINVILYYANDIFDRSGLGKVSGDLQAVAIGLTFLLSTTIAMTIIDRAGRRLLLLVGAAGTAACLAGVAAIFWTKSHEYMLVWLLVAYIAFFGFSQGTVIWVYISEVFPNRVRGKGQSLGSFTHWFMDALICGAYPLVAASFTAAPFVFFAAMTVVQFLVVLFVYPETKGVSLEAMQRKLATRGDAT